MVKYLFILVFFISSYNLSSQNQTKITYVANEGFLVETQDKKIIFDAFFNTIDENWCDSPNDSVLHLIRSAKKPFNNIDIIAISHKHRDHFNEEIVASHLLNNTKGIAICPEQVKESLSSNPNYSKFSERIIAITPPECSDTNILVEGIKIRVMRFEHSHTMITDTITGETYNKHRNIENLGYLIDMNNFKIFHCGDTNPLNKMEYSTYQLNSENIKLAFIERLFYARGKESIDILNKYIHPEKMIVMHINPNNKSMFSKYFNQIENVYMFENKMDTLLLNF